jgi:hypothetical protein
LGQITNTAPAAKITIQAWATRARPLQDERADSGAHSSGVNSSCGLMRDATAMEPIMPHSASGLQNDPTSRPFGDRHAPALTALALTLAVPVAAIPSLSWAASFDCNKARAPDEKAICANTALNDKDVKMSVLYEINKRTLAMGGRGAMQDAQQQWLRIAVAAAPTAPA